MHSKSLLENKNRICLKIDKLFLNPQKLLKALGADETICDHEGKRPTDLEDS